MKIAEVKLKKIIKEEVESNKALIDAIERLIDKFEDLDISIDFMASAISGEDPLSIALGQKSLGRSYRTYSHPGRGSREELDEQLKQIILEEVVDHLIDYQAKKFRLALREECARKGVLLTEAQEDEEVDLYKEMSRKDFLEKIKKGLIGGAAMATIFSLLGTQVTDMGREAHDRIESGKRAAAASRASLEGIAADYERYRLNQPQKWAWGWQEQKEKLGGEMEESPVTLPVIIDPNVGTIGILPPEFSVSLRVVEDFKNRQAPLFTQEEVPDMDPNVKAAEAEKNRESFPDDYNIPRKAIDKRTGQYAGGYDRAINSGFRQWAVGEGGYHGMLYMPIHGYDEDYVMPISGLTPSEYYIQEWKVLEDKLTAKK